MIPLRDSPGKIARTVHLHAPPVRVVAGATRPVDDRVQNGAATNRREAANDDAIVGTLDARELNFAAAVAPVAALADLADVSSLLGSTTDVGQIERLNRGPAAIALAVPCLVPHGDAVDVGPLDPPSGSAPGALAAGVLDEGLGRDEGVVGGGCGEVEGVAVAQATARQALVRVGAGAFVGGVLALLQGESAGPERAGGGHDEAVAFLVPAFDDGGVVGANER